MRVEVECGVVRWCGALPRLGCGAGPGGSCGWSLDEVLEAGRWHVLCTQIVSHGVAVFVKTFNAVVGGLGASWVAR